MGKRARIWPSWIRDVDTMIENDVRVRGHCDKCQTFYDIDLVDVRRKHPLGGKAALFNKKSHCKGDCPGFVRYLYSPAEGTPFMPMRDTLD